MVTARQGGRVPLPRRSSTRLGMGASPHTPGPPVTRLRLAMAPACLTSRRRIVRIGVAFISVDHGPWSVAALCRGYLLVSRVLRPPLLRQRRLKAHHTRHRRLRLWQLGPATAQPMSRSPHVGAELLNQRKRAVIPPLKGSV